MRYLHHMDIEKKREILQAAKRELMRHSWDTFLPFLTLPLAGGLA
jgi:hypothetical protein